MTDIAEETPAPEKQSLETLAKLPVRQAKPRPPRPHGDPDQFLKRAKQVVVDNYNASRNPNTTNELTSNGVYIVWFVKTFNGWKAVVASPIVFGLHWEVSHNAAVGEISIDVYKKVTSVRVPAGGQR